MRSLRRWRTGARGLGRAVLMGVALLGSATAQAVPAESAAASGAAAVAPNASQLVTHFRIRYVASGVVYLEGGRSAGLKEGMKLEVREVIAATAPPLQQRPAAAGEAQPDAAETPAEIPPVAQLTVLSVAETSAVAEINHAGRQLAAGDVASLSAADVQAMVDQQALSPSRQYPIVVSFTDPDPFDEEVRETQPRPPLPEVNRARGRFGLDYSSLVDHNSGNVGSTQLGGVFRGDITRIGGTHWNLSGYWRGRLSRQSSSVQPTLQDLLNRTYHLSLTYDNPGSRWVAGAGRLYLPWAVSLETLDGGYIGRRLRPGVIAGVFGGSAPDPTSYNYNPGQRLAGGFVNFEGGSFDAWRYTSTVGGGVSTLNSQFDRPFVFAENTASYKRLFSIYHAFQVDHPRPVSGTPDAGLGVGRSYFTVRLQPHERFSIDLNHTYFRDVPRFDPQLVGTGLLDKYLFQGFSVGLRAEVRKQVWVYTQLGRSSRSGDAKSALNQMYGVTFGDLLHSGLRADLRYSRFQSAFGAGSYESFSLSHTLRESMRLEFLVGQQNYASPIAQSNLSRFITFNTDYNLGAHYFAQGSLTVQRGGFTNYDQWSLALGYRFDNRGRGKRQ